MTTSEMQEFIRLVTDTWPQLIDQWHTGVYAETLRATLRRTDVGTAERGVTRWASEHNRPPTVMGLLGAIDQIAEEQRRSEAREPVQLPRPEDVAEEDRAIAKEAIQAIYDLCDRHLAMLPTGGYRRDPEELRQYIRAKGLTNYAGA